MALVFSARFNIRGEAVFWIVSLMFILAGVLFSFGLPVIMSIDKEIYSQKTSGRVIELFRTNNGYYYPVYEYKDKEGKVIQKKSTSGSTPPAFKEGDAVEIFYNPSNSHDSIISGENDNLLFAFKIIGYIFLSLGIFILLLTLPSIAIKIYSPQNTDYWFWWVNFIGGLSGALLFSLPSTFIWLIYYFLPLGAQSVFTGKGFLLWIFTVVGILVNAGVYFIAKTQLKGRAVWKS